MYKIDHTPYGYHLIFSGIVTAEEMQAWFEESKGILAHSQTDEFGVFVDMRELKPLDQLATQYMVAGQSLYKTSGMSRSVVILNSPVLTLQFFLLAKSSGIYRWERYLDASKVQNFEQIGLDWIIRGIDPDSD